MLNATFLAKLVHEQAKDELGADAERRRDPQSQADGAYGGNDLENDVGEGSDGGVVLFEQADGYGCDDRDQNVKSNELCRIFHVFFIDPATETFDGALARE